MKVLDNSKIQPKEDDLPLVNATPLPVRKPEPALAEVVPVRPAFSNAETAVIFFLRQFRVLLGAARLYQRNHPRLMEILASTEQQLRIALAARSPLVVAVETNGILLPRQEGSAAELLHDPRGELRALAEELLRSGICSFLFTHPINVGELDLLAHEISRVPRSATPGDTASRKLWDNWIKNRGIVGIRINIPTERRDSLLLASLMSAVLAYDNAAQHSSYSRAVRTMPEASFEQIAATLRVLAKLAPPNDPEIQPSTEDVARRFHSVVSGSEQSSISLIVYGVSNVKPREGETLEPYLERLTDELVLAFVKQEFHSGRTTPPGLVPLLVRLDQERGQADNTGTNKFGGSQHDELRVSLLCEKFWNAQPARVKAKTLRSRDAWCVPAAVVARFLEPLAAAAEKKKSEAAAREGRAVLLAYARCLESEEGKARRAVAAGLSEIAPQMERLWPHSSVTDFGRGVVQALLAETSPGIAGLLSAVVEKLARTSLLKRDYAEFERILETLEAAPRDDEHAHISTLVARILSDEQWLYLVDEALSSQPLSPVIPRLLKKCPDRLIDRLGLLLTGRQWTEFPPRDGALDSWNGRAGARRAGNAIVRSAAAARGDLHSSAGFRGPETPGGRVAQGAGELGMEFAGPCRYGTDEVDESARGGGNGACLSRHAVGSACDGRALHDRSPGNRARDRGDSNAASDRSGRASDAAGHLFPDQGHRSPRPNARAGSGRSVAENCEAAQRPGARRTGRAAFGSRRSAGPARKPAFFRAGSDCGKRAHEIRRGALQASPLSSRARAASPAGGHRRNAQRIRASSRHRARRSISGNRSAPGSR